MENLETIMEKIGSYIIDGISMDGSEELREEKEENGVQSTMKEYFRNLNACNADTELFPS